MSDQYGYGQNQNGPYGPYTPPPQDPTPPKRRRTGRIVVAVVVACFVGIITVGSCTALMFDGAVTAGTNDTRPQVKPTQSAPGPSVPTPTPTVEPTPEPKPTPTPKPKPAVKRWVTLTKLTGSSNKASAAFTTTGGRIKLVYTFAGSAYVVGAVYFLDEDQDLTVDGGIPEVMITESTRDATELHKAAGTYYVSVKAANARYTVSVQEYR